MPLDECKIKRNIATHLIEWLTRKALTTPNASKGMEKQKFSFIAD